MIGVVLHLAACALDHTPILSARAELAARHPLAAARAAVRWWRMP